MIKQMKKTSINTEKETQAVSSQQNIRETWLS